MRTLAAVLLLVALPVHAERLVWYDPAHPAVANAVSRYDKSGDMNRTPDFPPLPASPHPRLDDPDLTGYIDSAGRAIVPIVYWQAQPGTNSVDEMDASEKAAMDAFLAPDPDQEVILVSTPDDAVEGGMAARESGEIWVGSKTDHPVFLVTNQSSKVAVFQMSSGAKFGIGVTDESDFDARDTLVVDGLIRMLDAATVPCDVSIRGAIAMDLRAAGLPDRFVACMKGADDAYDWRVVFEAP